MSTLTVDQRKELVLDVLQNEPKGWMSTALIRSRMEQYDPKAINTLMNLCNLGIIQKIKPQKKNSSVFWRVFDPELNEDQRRIYSCLIRNYHRKISTKFKNKKWATVREIADYLNLSRSKVQKELINFLKRGVVQRNEHFIEDNFMGYQYTIQLQPKLTEKEMEWIMSDAQSPEVTAPVAVAKSELFGIGISSSALMAENDEEVEEEYTEERYEASFVVPEDEVEFIEQYIEAEQVMQDHTMSVVVNTMLDRLINAEKRLWELESR